MTKERVRVRLNSIDYFSPGSPGKLRMTKRRKGVQEGKENSTWRDLSKDFG